MKVRTYIAAAGAAALVGTGAVLLPAAASPHLTTHTLKFTSVEKKSIMFSSSTGGQQDTDVNKTGKTVGFDMLYFKLTSSNRAAVNLTVDTKGGFLYGTGTFNFTTNKLSHGKVTGGTGVFKGATGKIAGKFISNVREALTITYHT